MTILGESYLFTRDPITGFARPHHSTGEAMDVLHRWATELPGRSFDPKFETSDVLVVTVLCERHEGPAARARLLELCQEFGIRRTLLKE